MFALGEKIQANCKDFSINKTICFTMACEKFIEPTENYIEFEKLITNQKKIDIIAGFLVDDDEDESIVNDQGIQFIHAYSKTQPVHLIELNEKLILGLNKDDLCQEASPLVSNRKDFTLNRKKLIFDRNPHEPHQEALFDPAQLENDPNIINFNISPIIKRKNIFDSTINPMETNTNDSTDSPVESSFKKIKSISKYTAEYQQTWLQNPTQTSINTNHQATSQTQINSQEFTNKANRIN